MKKFLLCLMAAIVFTSTAITSYAMGLNAAEDNQTIISEANIPSEASYEEEVIKLEPAVVERVETTDREILNQKISECETRMAEAENMHKSGESLGYEEIVELADEEWNNANEDKQYYENIIQELDKAEEEKKWNERKEQYPIATEIWLYMKNLGWNDYVCAGIMGNLMAEVGGQTLDIQYTLYNPTGKYYGMCQWSKSFYGEIHGANLESQLNFLRDTIEYEMDTFGIGYDQFLSSTDEREAALSFAKGYERCGSGTYKIRQDNAEKAYEFFVD